MVMVTGGKGTGGRRGGGRGGGSHSVAQAGVAVPRYRGKDTSAERRSGTRRRQQRRVGRPRRRGGAGWRRPDRVVAKIATMARAAARGRRQELPAHRERSNRWRRGAAREDPAIEPTCTKSSPALQGGTRPRWTATPHGRATAEAARRAPRTRRGWTAGGGARIAPQGARFSWRACDMTLCGGEYERARTHGGRSRRQAPAAIPSTARIFTSLVTVTDALVAASAACRVAELLGDYA